VRVFELFDLSGRTALVTGGGRGIGRHLALGLAEAGADVFVASRKLAPCEETARAIDALGRRGRALQCDVGDPDSVAALAAAVLEETPRLDILVNNAGVVWGAPTLDYPLAGWDKVFAVNVRGLWLLSQHVARHMVEAGGGSIIHVSSISGMRGDREQDQPAIAYNASKGAVLTLTKDMAVKLAPHGVRVNGIAPGPFRTDMMAHVSTDEDTLRAFHERVPLGRSGEEDDVKGAVVFLASEAARFVTGHTLVVDGGMAAL
jgi:NAD(P)-dependent dehydrogenase (short-subunit alcohol dehydrogenase family)